MSAAKHTARDASVRALPGTEVNPTRRNTVSNALELRIEYWPIGRLRAYERNARKHSAAQIDKIQASIDVFGLVKPFLVEADGTLIEGHAVLSAAKSLGYTSVPVVQLDHLTETEANTLRLALNRLPQLASWDEKVLALEFGELLISDMNCEISFDLSITGFAAAEIDRIVTAAEDGDDATADDIGPDVQIPDCPDAPPISMLGDVWLLGPHRLICGDATQPGTYRQLLGAEQPVMGIHDVPYNVPINGHVTSTDRHHEFPMASGEMSSAEFTGFLTKPFRSATALMPPGAIHFAFIDWRHVGEMTAAGKAAGLELKNICVWNKGTGGMGSFYRSQHEFVFVWKQSGGKHINNVSLGKFGRNRTNVWDFPGAPQLREELKLHATPKPVALVAEAIRDCSNRNDLVLDAFCGSGTTIIAAAKTGRRAACIELDPRHIDTAVRRWERWSGETARHQSTGLSIDALGESRRSIDAKNGPVTSRTDGPVAMPAVSSAPAIRRRSRTATATATAK